MFTSSIIHCRICNGTELFCYLDLGVMPLVNSFARTSEEARQQERFPLQVLYCKSCGLSQLSHIIPPKQLFSSYAYRSSISKTFVAHCNDLVSGLIANTIYLNQGDLIVDIGSNDGTMLKAFQRAGYIKVLGVDPAEEVARHATKEGVPTLAAFWNSELAASIRDIWGPASVIIATNVFAHVADVQDFLTSCQVLLGEDGVIILEFPYLVDLLSKNQFDTIYHEHLSYFSLRPFLFLVDRCQLQIVSVQRIPIHGGSLRVMLQRTRPELLHDNYTDLIQYEEDIGLCSFTTYTKWAQGIHSQIQKTARQLTLLNQNGAKIYGFGASAKGGVLLNALGIGAEVIEAVIDDTPTKIGLFIPGIGIPIVSREILDKDPPDYLLLLAWNFTEEIMANTSTYREKGGKYILPIPRLEIL